MVQSSSTVVAPDVTSRSDIDFFGVWSRSRANSLTLSELPATSDWVCTTHRLQCKPRGLAALSYLTSHTRYSVHRLLNLTGTLHGLVVVVFEAEFFQSNPPSATPALAASPRATFPADWTAPVTPVIPACCSMANHVPLPTAAPKKYR